MRICSEIQLIIVMRFASEIYNELSGEQQWKTINIMIIGL